MKSFRVLCIVLSLCLPWLANAQVPSTMSYQGRMDSVGVPIKSPKNLTFAIYSAATGGTALWTEAQTNVPFNSGVFSVQLGSTTPGLPALFAGTGGRWLGVTIAGGSEMTPRFQFTSSPFAMRALQADSVADSAVTAAKIADSSVTSPKIAAGAVTSDKISFPLRSNYSSVTGDEFDYGLGYNWSSSPPLLRFYAAGLYAKQRTGTGGVHLPGATYALYADGNTVITGGYLDVSSTSVTWTATKPATVKAHDGSSVRLFSEEAAEVFFTDYGSSHLTGGRAHVELDPRFLETVTIDATHSMKVFVQLEGDCRGVFVTNKSATSFDVVEIQDGKSGVPFTYRVVCKRRYYEDERLATPDEDRKYNERMQREMWPELVGNGGKVSAGTK